MRITSEWIDERTDGLMSDMPPGSSHYRIKLMHKGRKMTILYSQGPAITGEPEYKSVLSSMMLDSQPFTNGGCSFEDWCSEYGYDTDSRKALAIYHQCERQSAKFIKLCGDDYESLAKSVENY